jgi:hypothetical protein
MAINVEERVAQLDSLEHFIESSREKFTSVLGILGWDADSLREKVSYKNWVLYVCGYKVASKYFCCCLAMAYEFSSRLQ